MVLSRNSLASDDEIVAQIHSYLENALSARDEFSVEQTRRTLENGVEACVLPQFTNEELELLSIYWHRCSELQNEQGEDALLMSLLREWFGPGADTFFELEDFNTTERTEMLRDFSHAITEKMIFAS